MKIIISHDVDHLQASDHYLHDLIIPKLWVRSFLHFCQRKISFSTLVNRFALVFNNQMNGIDAIVDFDKKEGIPATFFFGMGRGLGMSYGKKVAAPWIKRVVDKGFDVGVHGVDFQNYDLMKSEYNNFASIVGHTEFGIRNHYVRFNNETFLFMNQCGYMFDTTWFNKQQRELKAPYKIGDMWEFPLHIMDGHICFPGKLEEGQKETVLAIQQAEALGMPYCTILFHDVGFNGKIYPELKEWYEFIIQYLKSKDYEFVSYRQAINELEKDGLHDLPE